MDNRHRERSVSCQNLKSRVHFVGIGMGKKRPLPDQRSGLRTQDPGARRSRRGRRGSAVNQNQNGRNTLVKVKC